MYISLYAPDFSHREVLRLETEPIRVEAQLRNIGLSSYSEIRVRYFSPRLRIFVFDDDDGQISHTHVQTSPHCMAFNSSDTCARARLCYQRPFRVQ